MILTLHLMFSMQLLYVCTVAKLRSTIQQDMAFT
nr:MAG TPA: hypothetical protein [Caudoviricetes sp.]